MPGLQGKFKTARHNADDRVGLAVEFDRAAEDSRIAVETLQPQRITDDSERLSCVFFSWRKDAAKGGLNSEGREDAGGKSSGRDCLRSSAAREFILGGSEAADSGERAGRFIVGDNLRSGNANTRIASDVVP